MWVESFDPLRFPRAACSFGWIEMDSGQIAKFPSAARGHSRRAHRLLLNKTILVVMGALAVAFAGVDLAAQSIPTTVNFAKDGVGSPPTGFEFERTGNGDLGRWTVINDPTATTGFAIEHFSTDQHEDRFPLAIYTSARMENAEISARFKIIQGRMLTAGIAVCVRNPGDYYAVIASALEHRVDLFLFRGGKITRIEGAEADVAQGKWHLLGVAVQDDHFAVSLDQRLLFTAFDRARIKDGKAALLTQEDNITRFDLMQIWRVE